MKCLIACLGSALRVLRVRPVVPVVVLLLCALNLTARAQDPVPPANAPNAEVPPRARVLQIEEQAAALAKTVRASKPSPELSQQLAELKTLVAKAFELRQDIQEQELEELREQLNSGTQTLQKRDRQREKILERRVQELLKGDVGSWTEMKLRGEHDDADETRFNNQPLQDSPVVALKPLAERGPDDPQTIRADGQSKVVIARIQQALAREVTVEFSETPLSDAIEFLSQRSDLKILLDQAVAAAGTPADSPISMPPLKRPLRSILNVMLRPLNLTFVIEDEVMKITTIEDAQAILVVKVYHVSDLLDRSNKQQSLESLERALRATTEGYWQDTDGTGGSLVIQFNTQSLVISQSQQVHEEIENLLLALRTPRDPQVRFLRADGQRAADIKAIEAALAAQCPVNFAETPLSDAMQFFAQRSELTFLLDPAVEAAGTPFDSPISLMLETGTMKSALKLLLKPLNLTTIQRDGLLIVTTIEDAQSRLSTRVYELEDVLDPAHRATSLHEVMQTIQLAIGQWEDVDGVGGDISLAPTNARLIVRQSDATHEAITHLLDALRTKAP